MLDTISFPKDPLPASKFAIAKEFMDAMPPDFFEIPENQFEYFGPLWGDQVYTIQIARGGQIKTWTFSVVGGWDIGWFPYVDYWIKLYNTIDKLE